MITDELRRFANEWDWLDYKADDSERELRAIADRIDAEYEKAIHELNGFAEVSVLLPRDADGEVIHVGDVMEYGKARGHVIALMLSNYPKKWGGGLHWGIQLEGEHAPTALDCFFHHYNPPTVEDVLTDFARLYDSIGGHENEDELWETLLAEYAAKLQLRGESE